MASLSRSAELSVSRCGGATAAVVGVPAHKLANESPTILGHILESVVHRSCILFLNPVRERRRLIFRPHRMHRTDAHVARSLICVCVCWVRELIPVLGCQPAGDVSHKPGGRLLLLSARPSVTPETLSRAATNFAAR